MNDRHFDVIVVGSGPGGEGAAMKCTKAGKRVCLVERYLSVGGGCTHWGTIPSKALRHSIQHILEVTSNPVFRTLSPASSPTTPDFHVLVKGAESVIAKQSQMRQRFYDRNEVTLIRGDATFVGPNTIEVRQSRGAHERLTAENFVIATGSRPYRPPNADFSHPRIFDSDTILKLKHTPHVMTICGAGVIGCEYASMFRNLGVKINLINTREKLLSFLDDEIIDALSYHLRDHGVLIRHNEEMEDVSYLDDSVVLNLKSGKKIKSDAILFATGRTGNTSTLGLEALGIKPNSRGCLPINEAYQTSVPHIYAVGDVVGFPSLASAAYDQGRFAGTHLLTGHLETRLVKDIPTGIYTSPEISSLGRTEKELTTEKVPFEVGQAHFKSIARAQITGRTVGMLKLLFHRETLELLGIHCFGDQASEIIHIGQAIMTQEGPANTLMYFVNTTFNYPTMAEAYRVAALNGLNRVF
jgi:NAD(P) transhydrogenase